MGLLTWENRQDFASSWDTYPPLIARRARLVSTLPIITKRDDVWTPDPKTEMPDPGERALGTMPAMRWRTEVVVSGRRQTIQTHVTRLKTASHGQRQPGEVLVVWYIHVFEPDAKGQSVVSNACAFKKHSVLRGHLPSFSDAQPSVGVHGTWSWSSWVRSRWVWGTKNTHL